MGRLLMAIFPREKQPLRATSRTFCELGVGKNKIKLFIWSKIHSMCSNIYIWVFQNLTKRDWIFGLKTLQQKKIIVRNIGDYTTNKLKRTPKT